MGKLKLSIHSILFNVVLFCIYILPIYEFEQIGIPIDKYLFIAVVIMLYMYTIIIEKKITFFEVIIIFFSICFSISRRELSFLHIISIALMYRLLIKENYVCLFKQIIMKSKFIYMCLLAVVGYSILYFGDEGRYIHSSIEDPNMTGLSIFCLFSMLYAKNKRLGRVLLLIGVLTFSRSYLIAIFLFFSFELLKYKGIFMKINFVLLSVGAIVGLLILSELFINLEMLGMLHQYGTGINRYLTLFDYSNYYRFTINTNVLNIFRNQPQLLLTGIPNDNFYLLNALYCAAQNIIFFRIRPHNYFFAYLQIYGIWAILIFLYTYRSFKLVIREDGNSVSVPIFFYLMFLGIGASNYWLYLSIFTLIAITKFSDN